MFNNGNYLEVLFPDERHRQCSDLRKMQLVMLRMLKIVHLICEEANITYWLTSGTLLGAVRHEGFIPWDDDLDIAMPRKDFDRFIQLANDRLPKDMFLQTIESDPQYRKFGIPGKVRDRYSVLFEGGTNADDKYNGIFIDIFPIDKFRSGFFGFNVDYCLKLAFRALYSFYRARRQNGKSFKGRIKNMFCGLNQRVDVTLLLVSFRKILRRRIDRNERLEKNYILGFAFETPWFRFYSPGDIYPLRKTKFEDSFFYIPNLAEKILANDYGDYMTLPPLSSRHVHALDLVIDTRTTGNPPQ